MFKLVILLSGSLIFLGLTRAVGAAVYGEFLSVRGALGVIGVTVGCLSILSVTFDKNYLIYLFFLCLLGTLFGGVDVYDYYSRIHSEGNDYAWEFKGPFYIFQWVLLYIVYTFTSKLKKDASKH